MSMTFDPESRFGGLDDKGFLVYPNAYDCYQCHYGVSFSQQSLQRSRDTHSLLGSNGSSGYEENLFSLHSTEWESPGEHFAINIACPRCGAAVGIVFEATESLPGFIRFRPVLVVAPSSGT